MSDDVDWLRSHPRWAYVFSFLGALTALYIGLTSIDEGLEHGLLDLHNPVISDYFSFFAGMFFLILAVIVIPLLVYAYRHNWNLYET